MTTSHASDNWGHYFADMGGHTASIVFDDGIADTLAGSPLKTGLKVKVAFDDRRDNGLPTDAASQKLDAVDAQIESLIRKAGGLYLGRVTTNGARWIIGLTAEDATDLRKQLVDVAKAAGFEAQALGGPDPEHDVYWQDLYPTPADRQVMKDMATLNALADAGDNHDTVRSVQHWTFFPTKTSAETFRDWLVEREAYSDIKMHEREEGTDSWRWELSYRHNGTMKLADITSHTIALDQQATTLGGDYDGWETQVSD